MPCTCHKSAPESLKWIAGTGISTREFEMDSRNRFASKDSSANKISNSSSPPPPQQGGPTSLSSPTELKEEISKLRKEKATLEEYTKQTLEVFQHKYLLSTKIYEDQLKEKSNHIQLLEMELNDSKMRGGNCLPPATAAASNAPSIATASDASVSQKPSPPLLGGPALSSTATTTAASAPSTATAYASVSQKPPPPLLGGPAFTTAAASVPPSSAPQPQPKNEDLWTIFLENDVKPVYGEGSGKYKGLAELISRLKRLNVPGARASDIQNANLNIIQFVANAYRGEGSLLMKFARYLPPDYYVAPTCNGPVFVGPGMPNVEADI